jgi:cell division protease FtsH
MTISLPQEDKSYQSKKELTESIAVCLGGRVAEQLVLGDSSTGAPTTCRRPPPSPGHGNQVRA